MCIDNYMLCVCVTVNPFLNIILPYIIYKTTKILCCFGAWTKVTVSMNACIYIYIYIYLHVSMVQRIPITTEGLLFKLTVLPDV